MGKCLNKIFDRNEDLGMIPLACVLLIMFCIGGACASTAHADPFRAPNPGSFVRDSLKCETHLGKKPEDNYVRMTGELQSRRPSVFYVAALNKDMTDGQIVIDNDNKFVTFKLNGEQEYGFLMYVRGWDGNPKHTNKLDITMRGVAPDQYYGFISEYADNPEGQNAQNFLVTTRVADSFCQIMD